MKAKTIKKIQNIARWILTAAALYVLVNGIIVGSVLFSMWGNG